MEIVFYISAGIALLSTVMVITRMNAVHALLYLIVSLLAVAMVFFSLGAAFAAALEVIIYAGAIMVLFIFVAMMLNLGPASVAEERSWQGRGGWVGPSILCLVLLAEVIYVLLQQEGGGVANEVTARQVGVSLFGPYLIGVEISSMLLLVGLIGAFHLGRRMFSRGGSQAGGQDG